MENKLKSFINTSGVFNFVAICNQVGIEKTKGHRWLNGERRLTETELADLIKLMKKYGLKS